MTEGGANVDELKRALLAIRKLRQRVSDLEQARNEPIAIVGQACRLPGGASTPDKYWELMRDGVDATCDVPPERWDAEALYDPDPNAIGKSYVKRGGFLQEPVDAFDPQFFGISPREAAGMDPMHRLLLELAWEALEDAGVPPFSLEESLTGVYVGMSTSDYDVLQQARPFGSFDAYRGTGILSSIAGGRIAHFLGLQGPNFPIDTACSSSLVAIVMACEQLRQRRCNMAITGATNMMLSPSATVCLCRMQALSAQGRCRTFDAAGDGYSRGEGGGVIILKRLSDAEKDGDRILALIRGAAVNHDGHSSGLTVPNVNAQRKVIQAALDNGGLSAEDVDYVEAHGTATPLGDPIELRAINSVLCANRDADDPLLVGAVKTNIGHLEAAAGISGVLKVIQSLQHGQLPPHLNFDTPTPHVDWDTMPIEVVTNLRDWPERDRPSRAGVSAFGFSGTNAHVILEQAPVPAAKQALPRRSTQLLPISAAQPAALQALAAACADTLKDHCVDDMAYTLGVGRSHLSYRLAVVGDSSEQIAEQLREIGARADFSPSRALSPDALVPVFMFSGQGTQQAGMARDLYDSSPIFREALDVCAEGLKAHMEADVLALLLDESSGSEIDQTQNAQPALFAYEYALYQLWSHWGVEPAYVLGHSLGEYVAACVAGVIELSDALLLVAKRGQLMQALETPGAMLAVFADADRVRTSISGYSDVAIAAFNSAENIVISGGADSIFALQGEFEKQDVLTSPLQVSHAFHSPLMQPMLADFDALLAGITFNPPELGLISNLTGSLMDEAEACDWQRWRRHIIEPVQFAASMAYVREQGSNCFIEIGAHTTLCALGGQNLGTDGVQWLPSAKRDKSAWAQLCQSVGSLYESGYDIDFEAWNSGYAGTHISTPAYPFQRQSYWFVDDIERGGSQQPASNLDHPLLGSRVYGPQISGWEYQQHLNEHAPAYLADHRVFDTIVAPSALLLELMAGALSEGPQWSQFSLQDVRFERPLIVAAGANRLCQVSLGANESGYDVQVSSMREGDSSQEWIVHAKARAQALSIAAGSGNFDPGAMSAKSAATLYQTLAERGIHYGPSFRPLADIQSNSSQATAKAALHNDDEPFASQYHVHPAMLDACFQLLGALEVDESNPDSTRLPVGIRELRYWRKPAAIAHLQAQRNPDDSDGDYSADIAIVDKDNALCVEVLGFKSAEIDGSALRQALAAEDKAELSYQVQWQSAELPREEASATTSQAWLLLAQHDAATQSLEDAVVASGRELVCIRPAAEYAQSDGEFHVDPVSEAHWHSLTDALRDRAPFAGLIHAWSLNAESAETATGEELGQLSTNMLESLRQLLSSNLFDQGAQIRLLSKASVGPDGAAPRNFAAGTALSAALPVLQAEYPEYESRAIDLDALCSPGADVLDALLFAASDESRFASRNGELFVPRLQHFAPAKSSSDFRPLPDAENYRIDIRERGTLDALNYLANDRREPRADEVEVRLRATGLNFRDVLNVLGMYPGNPGPPGVEIAGEVVRAGSNVRHLKTGDRVFGLGSGAFAGYITTPADGLVQMPDALSHEEAASVPLAFLTSQWGLFDLAKLQPGERVLIHAAAGGVGQAAVQLALALGAEVHATAGNDEKRRLLATQGVKYVYSSREPSFAQELREACNGEGIDVVLNALTGEMLSESLALLREGGRFIELGKAEVLDPKALLAREIPVTYHAFDLGSVLLETPAVFQKMFNAMTARFATGELKPLRTVAFKAEQVVEAFRYMAKAQHIGKIIVNSAPGKLAQTDSAIASDGAYVVTGASGAIGREISDWLVAQGAAQLVLNARSTPTAESLERHREWEEKGVRVDWVQGDASDNQVAERLCDAARRAGHRFAGVFHIAGITDDALLSDLSAERIRKVVQVKVDAAWNLHRACEKDDLDCFVLFSSIAARMAGAGQAAYASGNAFLSALAERRVKSGLAGLAVEWGAWDGKGMAASLGPRERAAMQAQGMGFLQVDQALAELSTLMRDSAATRPIVADFDWQRLRANAAQLPPLFHSLVSAQSESAVGSAQESAAPDFSALASESADVQHETILEYVQSLLRAVLGLSDAQLTLDARLGDMGFDSLMAMELRNRLEQDSGVLVPVSVLLGSESLQLLIDELRPLLLEATANAAESEDDDWDEGEL